ncbi:sulfite exporter TauE/SafE family protein [Agarivorans aestuarii]|uniref:Probable membrane transporter protein n=1 Tax=Agarivorans aestuarii TaxID=1563703 RepID=A0ABU7G304_9ALTE|nr:sulfite exporter TauE/SafE family protein [Agarivorans aestuarii]MEE1673696.1 sulfite exporter TauE/SafE family protein [Agarivorans aestuarii]
METYFVIASLLVFLGAFIQTATGFGMAVVAAPVLIIIYPELIPGPLLVVGLFLAAINAFKYRKDISWASLRSAIIGLFPGTVAGGALLYLFDVEQFTIFVGVVVLLAVIISLLPIKIYETPNRLLMAGFISGFLGTSSGIGGPPLALLWQHQKAHLVRANLAVFMVVSCLMSLLIQIPIGYMSMQHVYLALPLLPASYLGYRSAILFIEHLPQKAVRHLSLLLCSMAGFGTIYSSLNSF